MKKLHPLFNTLVLAVMVTASTTVFAGDGTKDNPFTVAELNAQKDALAASGQTVWVRASLRGLGEDGTLTSNADTEDAEGKTVRHMAALFGDDTATFTAYSWQILGQLALDELTNTSDLLIALTYGTAGHPYGNTANPQYASNEEPAEVHFSLGEVHGALSLTIGESGLRGYHHSSCYVIPEKMVGVKVSAGYSSKNGAYVNYTDFDGASEENITGKNTALVLLAKPGNYDVVLTSAFHIQTMTNGNALNPGTQAGLNVGNTKNRARLRFVADAQKSGFQRNSDDNCTVTLESKDEVFLQVSSIDTNFWGNYAWETDAKDWISWGGHTWTDYADKYSTDGISDAQCLNSHKEKSGAPVYYNLSGQRVQQQRGLLIKRSAVGTRKYMQTGL